MLPFVYTTLKLIHSCTAPQATMIELALIVTGKVNVSNKMLMSNCFTAVTFYGTSKALVTQKMCNINRF